MTARVANRRPTTHRPERHTKASTAAVMRSLALKLLTMPGMDQEGIDNAGAVLDHVGEMLTPPRCGWHPSKPKGWKP